MTKDSAPKIRNKKAFISFFISILALAYSILIIRTSWTSLSVFDADKFMIILLFILSILSGSLGFFSIRKIKNAQAPVKGKTLSVFGIMLSFLSLCLLLLPGFVFFVNSIIHPPNYDVVLQLVGPSDRITQSLLERTEQVISSRIRYHAEPFKIRRVLPDKIIVTLRIPGKFTPDNLEKLFKRNQLSFNLVHQENETLVKHSADSDFKAPEGYKIYNDGTQNFFIKTEPELIENIADADFGLDSSSHPYVSIKLKPEGQNIFFRITQENIGRRLAIMIDDKLYSAPKIHDPIKGGAINLTGDFTIKEAADLAYVLKSGSIPLPLRIIQPSFVSSGAQIKQEQALNKTSSIFLKILIQKPNSNGRSLDDFKIYKLKDLGVSIDNLSPKIQEYLHLFQQVKNFKNISETWTDPASSLNNLFDEATQLKKELLGTVAKEMSLTTIINLGIPVYVFVNQNEDDTPKKAVKYLKSGEEEMEKGDLEKAMENFFNAFEINMNFYGLNQNMGFICYQLANAFDKKNDDDIAVAFFQKALQIDMGTLDPDDSAIARDYNGLGTIYQKKKEYAKAIEFYQKGLKIDLKKFSGNEQNYDKAATYTQAKNYDEAIKYFQQGIKPDAKYFINIIADHLNIGTAYRKLGDKETAATYLEKARSKSLLIFGPDNKLTKAAQKQLDWAMSLNKGHTDGQAVDVSD